MARKAYSQAERAGLKLNDSGMIGHGFDRSVIAPRSRVEFAERSVALWAAREPHVPRYSSGTVGDLWFCRDERVGFDCWDRCDAGLSRAWFGLTTEIDPANG